MRLGLEQSRDPAWVARLTACGAPVLALMLGLLVPIAAKATGTFPTATVGVAYSGDTVFYGPEYSQFSILDVYVDGSNVDIGQVPGLAMDPVTGTMHGTPTSAGVYHIYYQLYDGPAGRWGANEQWLTVNAPTLSLSPGSPAPGHIDTPYSQTFTAAGGTAPYSYALSTAGALPPGMSFLSDGTLTGTPTSGGTFAFAITVTDSSTGAGAPFSRAFNYSLVIEKNAQAITFPPGALPTPTFAPNGTFALSPLASASSGLPVSYSSLTGSVCTISGTTVTMLSAGNCTIAADQAGGAIYAAAAQVTLDIAIGQATQAITDFAANPAVPAYTPNGTFTVSATGGASTSPVVFGSTSPSICSVSGSTVTMLAAGTCALTADQAGDGNYSAAPQVTLDVAIGAGSQTVTFDPQPARAFVPNGSFALSPPASASSGLPVSYSSLTAGVCTINGTTVTMLAAGTCTIAVDQPGDVNYDAAAQVTQSIAIGKAAQAITGFAADPATPIFTPNGTFTVSATGGASTSPVVFASASTAVCTVSGNTVTMLSAGTCALTADQAGDGNYGAASQATLDVAIGAGSQTIVFGPQPAQTFAPNGSFALNPPANASSGLPVSYASLTSGVCAINGTTVTMLAAGTCTIAAAQAGDANYSAATQATQDIAIGQAAQAITGFASNPAAPVYVPNGSFGVSATGGASTSPVVFGSTSPSICSVSGSTVTMLGAGTCALTADQAGDGNYDAAQQITLEVTIGAATPVLTWVDALQRVIGEPAFDLTDPTSDSPGAFTFTSSDPAVATVGGRTVTIVGPGTTTLVATQAAVGNYTAGEISTTLTVAARPDPTRDPEVIGGIQAQVDASVRFAAAQQANIQGRLRQLRNMRGNPSSQTVSLDIAGGQGRGLSLPVGMMATTDAGRLPTDWGVWSTGTITAGDRDGTGGSGFEFRSDGLTVGVDRSFGRAVLGVAGGLGWNESESDNSLSRIDADQRSLTLYGLWRNDRWFVDGVLGAGRLAFDITRFSTVADATATARRKGDQSFAALGAGYAYRGASSTLTGYGRIDASRTTLDAYAERGLGIYDLRYDRQTVESSTAAFGVEGSHLFQGASVQYRPFWMLEYRQALEDRSTVGINYVLAPVSTDYVLGLRSYQDDMFVFGAGVDMALRHGWGLSLLLRREQGQEVRANSFGLQLSWGQATMGQSIIQPQAFAQEPGPTQVPQR